MPVMKKFLLVAALFSMFLSCNSDDSDDIPVTLVGQWRLVAVYSDPGDGSGSFRDVDSQKRVTFAADSTISSNGSLCNISLDANDPTSGTYDSSDQSISIPDCFQDAEFNPITTYEIVNNRLIISYLCIEGCQEKYKKAN